MRSLIALSMCVVLVACVAIVVRVEAAPITGGTGPGGIGTTDGASSLTIWLKNGEGLYQDTGETTPITTAGQSVARWRDQSGNDNHADQSDSGRRPTYEDPVVNSLPVVRFDSTAPGDSLVTPAAGVVQPFHVFSTFRWDGTGTGNATIFDGIATNAGRLFANAGGNFSMFTGGSLTKALGASGTLFHNFALLYNGSSSVFGLDGDVSTTGNPGTANPSLFQIGGIAGSEYAGVDFAEFIVFDNALNSVEQVMVDNYLSSKFGAALTAGDHYTGDTGAKGDFDLDVFGIGNDGTNSITNSGSQGLGIEELSSSLGSNEWVLAGHKVSENGITVDSSGAHWSRIWYLDETGDVDATLSFDFSDAGLSLGDIEDFFLFYSATDPNALAQLAVTPVVSGDTISFALTGGLLASGYYTLGVVFPIPEPATFALVGLGTLAFARRPRRRGGRRA